MKRMTDETVSLYVLIEKSLFNEVSSEISFHRLIRQPVSLLSVFSNYLVLIRTKLKTSEMTSQLPQM